MNHHCFKRRYVLNNFLAFLGLLLFAYACSAAVTVDLVATIPFSSLKYSNGQPIEGLGENYSSGPQQYSGRKSYGPYGKKQYGFIRAGRSVYFGESCWEYDLDTKNLKCVLPEYLIRVHVPYDGTVLIGCELTQQGQGPDKPFYLNTLTNKKKYPAYCPSTTIDPTHTFDLDGEIAGDYFISIDKSNIFTSALKKGPTYKVPDRTGFDNSTAFYGFTDFVGFTGNGKYVITNNRLFDAVTLRALKGNANSIPTNFDATLFAGLEWKNDKPIGAYVIHKSRSTEKYLWRNKSLGKPLAFSWNSDFLLVEGRLVRTTTGEILVESIRGTLGAVFSPDGRSFVTAGSDSFYIYSVPNNTSPIFGKYPGLNKDM